jgi:hypothetical protein
LFYTWFVPRWTPTLKPLYWKALAGDLTVARMTVFWKTTEAGYADVDGVQLRGNSCS